MSKVVTFDELYREELRKELFKFLNGLAETNIPPEKIPGWVKGTVFDTLIGKIASDILGHIPRHSWEIFDELNSLGKPLCENKAAIPNQNPKANSSATNFMREHIEKYGFPNLRKYSNVIVMYAPYISLRTYLFTYKRYADTIDPSLYRPLSYHLSWEQKYSTSIFYAEAEDDKTPFFYQYFDETFLQSFFQMEIRFLYADIHDVNFDGIFIRVLEMLNCSMNQQKIFMDGTFEIIIDYTKDTQRISHTVDGSEIIITELLGEFRYILSKRPQSKITLFMHCIYETAKEIRVDPEALMKVVYIHELMHFAVIMGAFSMDRIIFEFMNHWKSNKKFKTDEYHEKYAQYFTYKMVKSEPKLMLAFLALNELQSDIYTSWRKYENMTVDEFIYNELFLVE